MKYMGRNMCFKSRVVEAGGAVGTSFSFRIGSFEIFYGPSDLRLLVNVIILL